MSKIAVLYGCIQGAHGRTDDWCGLYTRNKTVIEALPETDEWPPLTKGMFSVPNENKNLGFYRIQMIHFGASFNHFSDVWENWLNKFENLLKAMYWYKTNLHLEIELIGRYDFVWQVDSKDVQRFYLKPPVPVDRWSFSGGPRRFEI